MRFSESALRELLLQRLRPLREAPHDGQPPRGDFDLNPQWKPGLGARNLRPAAVLVPIVTRKAGLHVLFTERAQDMPSHPGQVSFPGGRMQADDADAVATALRETEEETGIAPEFIEPLGLLDSYETGSGYAISPVVAFVREGFAITRDTREVADIFEAPFDFLMDPDNHERHAREWQGTLRHFYAMPYDGHYIWGATAGMIVNLYERILKP